MIDNIFCIEEFKQVLQDKKLKFDNIRKCIESISADKLGIYSKYTIYLTIPGLNNEIIQCVVARKLFSQFATGKDTKENEEYHKWLKDANDLIRKHFDFKIISGRWE